MSKSLYQQNNILPPITIINKFDFFDTLKKLYTWFIIKPHTSLLQCIKKVKFAYNNARGSTSLCQNLCMIVSPKNSSRKEG
jgi:hypothetical protein